MKISINNTLETEPKSLIIPIASKQETALQRVADMVDIPLDALKQDFSGDAGEVHTLYNNGTRIVMLGMGSKFTPVDLTRCMRLFSHKHTNKLDSQLTLSFLHDNLIEGIDEEMYIEAAVNGLLLGQYNIGKYKNDATEEEHPMATVHAEVSVLTKLAEDKAIIAAKRGLAMAETQMSIFDLVNAPSNKKTPQHLAEWAVESGKNHGFSVHAMDKAEIEALGFEALLAVNQGSPTPPYFIVMEYKGKRLNKKVGLVGKGVTFDTGGLSIKPSANMHLMKSDMGGAAAVLGTMEMAARLQLPIHLIGIVPTTDNSVDAHAVKPSDVIGSYSGKTIEVIDTDAEGRLILADGLSYMVEKFEPEILIDLATLTGSAVRTFGYHAGALFSNNDQLAEQLSQCGQRTGERLWRLPMWDVYKEDIKSDVADVRNYSGRPIAGAIGAAKFLEVFTNDHPRWAHMDIAGVAFNDTEFSMQKSATGFGIRLLLDFLEQD